MIKTGLCIGGATAEEQATVYSVSEEYQGDTFLVAVVPTEPISNKSNCILDTEEMQFLVDNTELTDELPSSDSNNYYNTDFNSGQYDTPIIRSDIMLVSGIQSHMFKDNLNADVVFNDAWNISEWPKM